MEETLQEKRLKLLDLQIAYEELRIRCLKEKHEEEMQILKRKRFIHKLSSDSD